jgi:type I restriction enzyme S subunit
VPTEAELARAEGRDYEPASVLLERILAERRRRWEDAELGKMKAKGKTPKNDKWKAKYKQPVAPPKIGLPELPVGWCWGTVDQLTSRITSGSRDWTQYYNRGTSVFLMAQNVRPGRLDLAFKQFVDPPPEDSSCERSQVLLDDLLVTIVGANTGNVCRIPSDLPRHYVCQSVALMRPVDPSTSKYLDAYLNSPSGQRVYEEFMYGQGRPHLSFDNLRETPVPLPPVSEQSRIIESAARMQTVAVAIAAEVQGDAVRCRSLRQSVLKWAFEGKLVDQCPSDEPASALLKRIEAEREAAASTIETKKRRRKKTRSTRA